MIEPQNPEAGSISPAGEWSELGSRDMDCIGRMVMRPRERERTSHYNLYRYCHNDASAYKFGNAA